MHFSAFHEFPPTTVSLPASTVSQANSQGQLVLGTGVNFNIRPPFPLPWPCDVSEEGGEFI